VRKKNLVPEETESGPPSQGIDPGSPSLLAESGRVLSVSVIALENISLSQSAETVPSDGKDSSKHIFNPFTANEAL